ncbi:hypothetical protein GQ53DRAFT_755400 [Thozetella sp. PMI_491]|nr:hypothetical protein GQ53DRAFT_755400 [Thozetella sp. PMI_491]
MHRPAIRFAFGRGRQNVSRSIRLIPLRARPFSTSQCQRDNDKPQGSFRERSAAAASKLSALRPSVPKDGVDARSLRSSSPAATPQGPKVINLRSLRVRKTPSGLPGRPGGFRPPRGPGAEGGPRTGGPRTGGRPGFTRGNRPTQQRRRRRKPEEASADGEDKAGWSPEEQTILNRSEQGVPTPYAPQTSLETLTGYGPAIASKFPQSQVERAMRAMRILGGGRPFESSVVYDDPDRRVRRLHAGKAPLFFDTIAQKEWLNKQGVVTPRAFDQTRTAIVDATILGKYERLGPKYAQVGDTMGVVANYQGRLVNYRKKEMDMFNAKLESLLPKAKLPPSQPETGKKGKDQRKQSA